MGGNEFICYGRSLQDVTRFIDCNFDRFGSWVRQQENAGIVYTYKIDGQYANLEQAYIGITSEVEIVEAIPGSGGLGRVLVGAALIGAAFVPGLPVLAIGASKIALSSVALSLGLSLALGGLATLLTPKKNTENNSSTSLGGTLSRTPQGRVIPVGFGECYFPLSQAIVLSAGVDVRDIDPNSGGKGGKGK